MLSDELNKKKSSIRFSKNKDEAIDLINRVAGIHFDRDRFLGYEKTQDITEKMRGSNILIDQNSMVSVDKKTFKKNIFDVLRHINDGNYFLELHDIESGYVTINGNVLREVLIRLSDYHEKENFTFSIVDADLKMSIYLDYYYDATDALEREYEFAVQFIPDT